MKIKGTTEIEVEVTLHDIVAGLTSWMINEATTKSLHNPQTLHVEIKEEADGSMWVKEHRFDQTMSYPVPEKEQELFRAIKNLQKAYANYSQLQR